jgi:hypothetical protein
VKNPHVARESLLDATNKLGCERYVAHQDKHLRSEPERLVRGFEKDMRLAAARDPVKEKDMWLPRANAAGDGVARVALITAQEDPGSR